MAQIMIRPNQTLTLFFAMLMSMLTISGCSNPPVVVDGKMPIEIGGQTFMCEIVADPDTRELGLGKRESLPADEGMIFSFPDSSLRSFVMRDCLFPIDIIFLDSAGRIVAMHHMPVEEPIQEGETRSSLVNGRLYAGTYELRLAKYSSRYNAQYAIELLGGTLEQLNLNEGDRIDFDTEYLQSITR
ncbi:MAG: DUF192 domain-containing protein [Phycisphaerales bacterium JB052]